MVPDVVGELLVEDSLKVGSTASLSQMAVGGVGEEELPLGGQRILNVLPSIDVL